MVMKKAGSKKSVKSLSPLQVGNKVLIRSVTMYYIGCIVEINFEKNEVVLVDASWVGDTGSFSTALATGTLGLVEPYLDPVSVGIGAIVDTTLWRHALPQVAK